MQWLAYVTMALLAMTLFARYKHYQLIKDLANQENYWVSKLPDFKDTMPQHLEECDGVVVLPDGRQGLCPVGFDNRYVEAVKTDAGCDATLRRCMGCIGSTVPMAPPGKIFPDMDEWPITTKSMKSGHTYLATGPRIDPYYGHKNGYWITNPMPVPVDSNCAP